MENLRSEFTTYRSFIGCCLLVLLHTGVNSVSSAAMSYLTDYYNCEVSTIVTALSASSFVVFFASLVGAQFIKFVKPKGAFLFSSICCAIFCILVFISNNIVFFFIGSGLMGLAATYGGYITSNVYINQKHPNRAATFITTVIAVGMLGGAFFQFISGFVLVELGLKALFYIMLAVSILCIVVNYLFLDNIEVIDGDSKIQEKNGRGYASLYFSSRFIKIFFVTLFGSALAGTITPLFTTFLISNGMPTQAATSYLSAYTMIGGFVLMAGGILADKFGYRLYIVYLYVSFLIAVVLCIVFNNTHLAMVLPPLIVFLAISRPCGSTYHMLSKPLFEENALKAQTILSAVGSISSAFIHPTFARVYEIKGFNTVFSYQIVIALFCMILLLSAMPKKEEK